jgi:nitrous oxidase accessory protein
MWTACLLLLALAQAPPSDMGGSASGAIEGRPPATETSPLQQLIDKAPAGGTVEIGAGTYRGDLVIDRPLRHRRSRRR